MRRLALLAVLIALPGARLASAADPLPARGTVEVYFSPWDDAERALVDLLAGARETVHVQAFLLTSRTIARALREAHGRGVRVAILADHEMAQKTENSQLDALARDGVAIWRETRYASAHNKVILVDAAGTAPVVATGSYNFTWSAQARNAENLLILRGHPELARRYLDNWQRHRADAQPWN